jgi:hypothetical protein
MPLLSNDTDKGGLMDWNSCLRPSRVWAYDGHMTNDRGLVRGQAICCSLSLSDLQGGVEGRSREGGGAGGGEGGGGEEGGKGRGGGGQGKERGEGEIEEGVVVESLMIRREDPGGGIRMTMDSDNRKEERSASGFTNQ